VQTIENQGAHVAGDLLCYGVRGLGNKVETSADPLDSIARAYLYQIPCARMIGEFPRRYQMMLDLYRDVQARGIIYQRIKFCQIWSTEVHNLRHRFEEDPIPMLVLDREYGLVHAGQVKTRVQAFIESLRA
jgi:benzoyl-CoA reductase/2-hydroxyglutaryl-CoA dehydratase subunit BcrC/BadD/HgdB